MERISAFMDGEVEDHEVSAQIARLKQDPALRETWNAYHLIGDAMRGDTAVAPGFMDRFSAALAQEPTVLAPKAPVRKSSVRRFALPLAASFGGVALVAWLALSSNPFMPTEQKMATLQPPASSKPDDGAAKDYIMAHRGVTSYVRQVATREEDMR